jgi:hypothetical protein
MMLRLAEQHRCVDLGVVALALVSVMVPARLVADPVPFEVGGMHSHVGARMSCTDSANARDIAKGPVR